MESQKQLDSKLIIAASSALSFLTGYGLSVIFRKKQKSKDDEIRELVKTSYARIAKQSTEYNKASCCGIGASSSCCSTSNQGSSCGTSNQKTDYSIFSDDYTKLDGYCKNADLGLGCGIPTEFAEIKKGNIVIDLGSGAGNDCFIARSLVGETGKVIGIDMTPEMIIAAQVNSDKKGYNNVEFRMSEIENMPILDNFCDVVISNCVINLVPDKKKAYTEIFRVLKSHGHFSISDVVTKGNLPKKVKKAAELYAGCVAGALTVEEQHQIIKDIGFVNLQIKKEKEVQVPKEIFLKYLSQQDWDEYQSGSYKILSQTLYAEKP